jgi:hypothetical protein
MSGIRIAHLINPVKVSEDRDLYWQQPITFASMSVAKEFARLYNIDVEHVACFYPEDKEMVPDWFFKLEPLTESTEGKFKINRKLPYFKEMLDRLYEESDADYFIQTNADIGLQPHFYILVKELIDGGNESFCINKRILPEAFVESLILKNMPLSLIWSFLGGTHAGHDCFVFPSKLYPKFDLGDIVMGTPWSETTLITNMVAYAKNFNVFKHANATFHLGDRRIWIGHEYNDYRIHNTNEFARILKRLSKKNENMLNHDTIRYLLSKLKVEVKGYKNEVYSKNCWDLIQ